jgi:HK97 family phage portal protein
MFDKLRHSIASMIAPAKYERLQQEAIRTGRSRGGWQGMMNPRRIARFSSSPAHLAAAVTASVWLDVCVSLRAQMVAEMPYNIINKYTKQPVTESPLHNAIDWAYQRFQQNLFYLHEQSRATHGETYYEKLYIGKTRIPGGIKWLNPGVTYPEIINGEIYEYTYNGSGLYTRYPVNEIFFHRLPNPADDLRGKSPVAVVLDELEIDRNSRKFIHAFYANDATPGGVLTLRNNAEYMNREQEERLIEQWRAQLKGVDSSFSTILLPAGLEYQKIGGEPPTTHSEQEEAVRTRMCAAMHVPVPVAMAALVGDSLSASATMDSQRAMFYENTIIPECREIERFWNAIVLPWLSPAHQLQFDFTAIYSLIEATLDKEQMLQSRLDRGVISLNEYRETIGIKPIAGGDIHFFNPTMVAIPTSLLEQTFAQPIALVNIGTPVPAPLPGFEDDMLTVEAPTAIPQLPFANVPANDMSKDAPLAAGEAGSELWIGLHIGAHPDILAMQRAAQQVLSEHTIEWEKPDEYHITLLYAPNVPVDSMRALRAAMDDIDFEYYLNEMKLKLGSLNAFDTLGSHAIHIRIRNNPLLNELHDELYILATGHGIQMQGHYAPALYHPHITLGYSDQKARVIYHGRTTIAPASFRMDSNHMTIFEYCVGVGDTPPADADAPTTPETAEQSIESADQGDARAKTINIDYEGVLAELDTWQTFQLKRVGKSVSRQFTPVTVYETLANAIRASLLDVTTPDDVKNIFVSARTQLELDVTRAYYDAATMGMKGYLDIRRRFTSALIETFEAGRNNDLSRRQFAGRMRTQLRTYGLEAFREGIRLGNGNTESLSTEQVTQFNRWLGEQVQYIAALGREMYAQGFTETQVLYRAELWANRSLDDIYEQGRASAAPSQLAVFVLGPAIDHCADCLYLNGKISTRIIWETTGWKPRSGMRNRHACGGWNCQCELVDTDEPVNIDLTKYNSRGRKHTDEVFDPARTVAAFLHHAADNEQAVCDV